MTWVATFQGQKGDVGTLTATFDDGVALPWSFSLSVDLSQVKDLTPYADKIKAIYADYLAESQKPDPNALLVDALTVALNEGK